MENFKKQLEYISKHTNYELQTELGFSPKVVIVKTQIKFAYYIYLLRTDFLNDEPAFNGSFNTVDEFLEQIKRLTPKSLDVLLTKFIEVKINN